jgi:hypothetical protein
VPPTGSTRRRSGFAGAVGGNGVLTPSSAMAELTFEALMKVVLFGT